MRYFFPLAVALLPWTTLSSDLLPDKLPPGFTRLGYPRRSGGHESSDPRFPVPPYTGSECFYKSDPRPSTTTPPPTSAPTATVAEPTDENRTTLILAADGTDADAIIAVLHNLKHGLKVKKENVDVLCLPTFSFNNRSHTDEEEDDSSTPRGAERKYSIFHPWALPFPRGPNPGSKGDAAAMPHRRRKNDAVLLMRGNYPLAALLCSTKHQSVVNDIMDNMDGPSPNITQNTEKISKIFSAYDLIIVPGGYSATASLRLLSPLTRALRQLLLPSGPSNENEGSKAVILIGGAADLLINADIFQNQTSAAGPAGEREVMLGYEKNYIALAVCTSSHGALPMVTPSLTTAVLKLLSRDVCESIINYFNSNSSSPYHLSERMITGATRNRTILINSTRMHFNFNRQLIVASSALDVSSALASYWFNQSLHSSNQSNASLELPCTDLSHWTGNANSSQLHDHIDIIDHANYLHHMPLYRGDRDASDNNSYNLLKRVAYELWEPIHVNRTNIFVYTDGDDQNDNSSYPKEVFDVELLAKKLRHEGCYYDPLYNINHKNDNNKVSRQDVNFCEGRKAAIIASPGAHDYSLVLLYQALSMVGMKPELWCYGASGHARSFSGNHSTNDKLQQPYFFIDLSPLPAYLPTIRARCEVFLNTSHSGGSAVNEHRNKSDNYYRNAQLDLIPTALSKLPPSSLIVLSQNLLGDGDVGRSSRTSFAVNVSHYDLDNNNRTLYYQGRPDDIDLDMMNSDYYGEAPREPFNESKLSPHPATQLPLPSLPELLLKARSVRSITFGGSSLLFIPSFFIQYRTDPEEGAEHDTTGEPMGLHDNITTIMNLHKVPRNPITDKDNYILGLLRSSGVDEACPQEDEENISTYSDENIEYMSSFSVPLPGLLLYGYKNHNELFMLLPRIIVLTAQTVTMSSADPASLTEILVSAIFVMLTALIVVATGMAVCGRSRLCPCLKRHKTSITAADINNEESKLDTARASVDEEDFRENLCENDFLTKNTKAASRGPN